MGCPFEGLGRSCAAAGRRPQAQGSTRPGALTGLLPWLYEIPGDRPRPRRARGRAPPRDRGGEPRAGVGGGRRVRLRHGPRAARRRRRGALGRGLLLRRPARRGAPLLGGVLRARPRAGRPRAQPLPRPDRRGALGLLRLRLLGAPGGADGVLGAAVPRHPARRGRLAGRRRPRAGGRRAGLLPRRRALMGRRIPAAALAALLVFVLGTPARAADPPGWKRLDVPATGS